MYSELHGKARKSVQFYGSELLTNADTTKQNSSAQLRQLLLILKNYNKSIKKRYNQPKLLLVLQWKNNKQLGEIPGNILKNFPGLIDNPAAQFPTACSDLQVLFENQVEPEAEGRDNPRIAFLMLCMSGITNHRLIMRKRKLSE